MGYHRLAMRTAARGPYPPLFKINQKHCDIVVITLLLVLGPLTLGLTWLALLLICTIK